MKTLAITALTAGGQAYEIDFPLHPNTRSADAVADLVTAQLATVSEQVAKHRGLSDGDILQAMAMTLAIRSRMAGGSPESMNKLMGELFETAYTAALASQPMLAGRA